MNDQRMVDVELLEEAIKTMCDLCTNDSMPAVELLEDKLRAIIDGPGVEPVALWQGANEWEQLAYELCAEEHGEEACHDLIWDGGYPPEPWGERWQKYEGEAKRMIELVRKFAPSAPVRGICDFCGKEGNLSIPTTGRHTLAACEECSAPAAPVQDWPVLDKPAKVGGGRFRVGVSSRLVVEAAQRHYEYEVTPEKEAERIARSAKAIDALVAPVQAVPDGWQLVPKKETPEMHDAVMSYLCGGVSRLETQRLLDSYLASAPQPPATPDKENGE